MCERSPAARVTAVDLPEVLPVFRERAERLGLSGRTEAIAAEYRSIELPDRGFDRRATGLSGGELVFCDAPPRALAALVHRTP